MPSLYDHALYQVATKALLFKDDKILVLITQGGHLDFPGGRVDESERSIAWTESLRREVAEEIGENVAIDIGATRFVSKRQYYKNGVTHHIAAIFFECQYLHGDVQLSEEHREYEWVTPHELLSHRLECISEDERTQLTTFFNLIN